MMNCTAYRRALLADPHAQDVELREHRAGCDDCNQFTVQLLRFESRLDRALRVALPVPARRTRWLAMAASALLAMVVAGALWLGAPHLSLAADVVTHMKGEPEAWRRTEVAVPADALQAVLEDSRLQLAGEGLVSYASSCLFRGHQVPHLVIQTASGPVTVMVLVHESVSAPVRFDEQGYRGVIVPMPGHGSLAVLTRGPTTGLKAIERIAAQVQTSIVWTG